MANAGLLTNIEVMDLLQEKQNRTVGTRTPSELHGCIRLVDEAIAHIKDTVVGSLTSAQVRDKLSATKKLGFGLTEGELVLIANHAPSQPVEVHMVSCVLINLFIRL